ncbi:Os05g0280600, partial [Oryza sativa Japonica Group]
QHLVLVLSRLLCQLECKRLAEHALYPVCGVDTVAVTACLTVYWSGADGLQELDVVLRSRIQHEVEWVQPLGGRLRRRAVEHVNPCLQRNGGHLAGELSEEWAKPKEVRLTARGALGAHHEVAARQQRLHAPPVLVPVARQARRADWRNQLRYRAYTVRHRSDGLVQHGRDGNRVQERAVVADVEATPGRPAVPAGGIRRRAGDQTGAHASERGERDGHTVGEEAKCQAAEDGEEDTPR